MEKSENDFETKPELEFESALGTPVKVEILTGEQRESILSNSLIRTGRDNLKSPSFYKENGLEPYALMTGNEGLEFAFSRPYKAADRTAFIGYAREGQVYVIRTYYLSNSHAVFKYLPSFLGDEENVVWFDKGFSESSISVSYPLQRALSHLNNSTQEVQTKDDPLKIFVSTTRNLNQGTRATYGRSVDRVPEELVLNKPEETERQRAGFDKRKKQEPETITVSPEHYPDFSNKLATWYQENNLYGKVIFTSFYSMDKNILYTFASDIAGRSWVANIEPVSKTNALGVHATHFDAMDLTTPAFEHMGQSGGYSNPSIRKMGYVDMFKNYISKIKMIQDFQAQEIPIETEEFPIPDTKIA